MLTGQQLKTSAGILKQPKAIASTEEKVELVETTTWGQDFSFEQVKNLAPFMDLYQVGKETVLFAEGEKDPYLILIARGEVDVVKLDASNTPQKISTLGKGKTIGEMSLIDGEPRSASAMAATDVTLLVMTAASFNVLNETRPSIGLSLVLKIAKQMSQYLRLTSGRLVDHLGETVERPG